LFSFRVFCRLEQGEEKMKEEEEKEEKRDFFGSIQK
jgi:hypothetical protein